MLQELRKEKGLTQVQLAEKCGTTKTYISRIENNASDIRLSTLIRIVNEGFGGFLKLSCEFLIYTLYPSNTPIFHFLTL